ncbi:MAG TPA: UDP-N-acetylglucosamine--N-acetylmuramyl-(pentapeptide) pyrophosphoryl-undecaprenol N-acetylglucosamine transferase [Eubacteriales bacterium]|jgi:UDP-N-acetylglucosamine--N-acetylmuramyl-(pentapeptide) pyrophosphoryl-undecaprenol N-acetylglucosamine transferase|nr:UDP-N-acetylglucosamine--N-acetylmuramyl-(pentapeptide) pyrophosphoryl-undecaprenol N-acetylglucosamine transferase [Clostridia bacterium]HRR89658.1 UDP-N-acetylglucosamine--N-acetylmuramyl-(pentapeptide) pyrophosphoryl-undecaprenol N-acetylglucosamine transferase [Eubacteriales bacterium]HRU84220.1 UDP-N-acetylglucosamine--N-acetylmuramyl-(pentapeptide) pyrophosphoryl-undecaprenol N-acetylglucosamine transferase [Eubacteriales bacterium]
MAGILLSGGGTGGHVFPCLALIPELRVYFSDIWYMGGSGIEKEQAALHGIPFFEVESPKLVRKPTPKNLTVPFGLLKARGKAVDILKDLKPSVVFGKGGYASLPAMLAAAKLGIPKIAHESDFSLGLANKIAKAAGARIITAFPIGFETVGMPLRREIYFGNRENALKLMKDGYFERKPFLLVVGGSGGAAAINAAVYGALESLLAKYNVIHIAGKGAEFKIRRKGYSELKFSDSIWDLYVAADVVVSRSGATALAELSALRKKAVLIPLPKGRSRGDQVENAEYAKKFGAHVLNQEALNGKSLLAAVEKALASPPMEECLRDGREKIALICFEESKKRV